MNPTDVVVIIVVAVIVLLAGGYVYKEKKRGNACIGCPYGKTCGKKKSGNCACNKAEQNKK